LDVDEFSDPPNDSEKKDLNIWLPRDYSSDSRNFKIQTSVKILGNTGSQFCMYVKDMI